MNEGGQAQTWLAMLVLLAWPLVGLWLYASYSASRATILIFLVAFLVLPVGAASNWPKESRNSIRFQFLR